MPPGPREPCVVDAAPLAAIVRSFVDTWNTERPPLPPTRQSAREGVQPVGAVAWLAKEADVPRATIDKLLSGKLTRTGLGTADALLTAVGHPEELWNDSIPVVGNPNSGLRFARPRSYSRISYSARIELAGQTVGRVRRFGRRNYLAYDDQGRIVAHAPSVTALRRELRQSRIVDSFCCGGSGDTLTGTVQPRPDHLTGTL